MRGQGWSPALLGWFGGGLGGRGLRLAALGELVGEAGGLGEAVASTEAEDPVGGFVEGDAMADGDVDGGDAVAGAEDEADEVGAVAQLGAASRFGRRDVMTAHEAALGDAYRRDVEEEAEVAGDAEAALVGEAVAVHEEEVRGALQLLEGASEDGDLAEGEEAGDIGEGYGLVDGVLLDEAEVGVGEEDDGAAAVGPFDPSTKLRTGFAQGRLGEGDVGAGDVAHPPRPAFRDDLRGEAGLDGDGLGGGDAPGVEVTESHGVIVGPVAARVSRSGRPSPLLAPLLAGEGNDRQD